jgi:hypothetical protein
VEVGDEREVLAGVEEANRSRLDLDLSAIDHDKLRRRFRVLEMTTVGMGRPQVGTLHSVQHPAN